MLFRNEFKDRDDVKRIVNLIRKHSIKDTVIMEVCGTHTMSIARAGIKELLPSNIRLVSGPGCPVCVTPSERIDDIYVLSRNPNVITVTYGDMFRVPGTRKDISLERSRMEGSDIRMVYSSMDALEIAVNNPQKEVVFLGIGFETTAPAAAAAIKEAQEKCISNFSVFSLHKTVEPVMRKVLMDRGINIDGFLLPGHVSVILGEEGFHFLLNDFRKPGVIAGFEPVDILSAVLSIVKQVESSSPAIENEYTRLVSYRGNVAAKTILNDVYEPYDDIWRGLGYISSSGLRIRDRYRDFDTVKKLGIKLSDEVKKTPCRCGDVLKGIIEPRECPLYGKECIPESPVGPCMVSSEGSCAAAYKYS